MNTCLEIVERRADLPAAQGSAGGQVAILQLAGHLVVDEGDRIFRDCVDSLVRDGRTQILVDLRNVTYVDSGGVGVLVSKYLTVKKAGGQMKLLCLSSRACRVLQITGLLGVFEVYDSEEEALRSFRTPARARTGAVTRA